MKKSKKILLTILCIFLALIIIFVGTFFILRAIGKNRIHKDDKNIKTDAVEVLDDDIVSYNGKKYKLNPNIISTLIMGVDKQSINKDNSTGKNGQADAVFVMAIDTEKKTFKLIPISRETMTDINIYSESNKYMGTEKKQICLAYAYGDTAENSSKNMVTAVERYLYGINISSYVTIDFDGISKFTKALGGVDVEAIGEDMTVSKKNYSAGEKFTVSGSDAVSYIRYRGGDVDSNNRRMQRQKLFFNNTVSKTSNMVSDDFTRLATYYNMMSPYVSTDISLAELTYIASECLVRDLGSKIEYKQIEGEMKLTNIAEFHPNEDSLLSTVIDVFYTETK